MAEKMEVKVRIYDQTSEDPYKYVDICSYDNFDNLIAVCTENETYVFNAIQLKKAIDNALHTYEPGEDDRPGIGYRARYYGNEN